MCALLNDLVDVMIVEPRSYRREISWKNMFASSRSSLSLNTPMGSEIM